MQDSPPSATVDGTAADGAGAGAGPRGDSTVAGGYQRGVFVRAARGSSIDVGLFHDDQRRSVATVEVWVNAGEQVSVLVYSFVSARVVVFSRYFGPPNIPAEYRDLVSRVLFSASFFFSRRPKRAAQPRLVTIRLWGRGANLAESPAPGWCDSFFRR